MLHPKLAVTDDVLARARSANVNSRSLLLNYELMFSVVKAGSASSATSTAERPGQFGRSVW
jgi:phosphatidylserine/phosphatidylglycerophosphate/cardiolipin synthase-like enzyme